MRSVLAGVRRLAAAASVVLAGRAAAQPPHAGHGAPSAAPVTATRVPRPPRLGRVAFATSAAPAAREPFLRGVLWLHSFEYDHAAAAFREAQRADPGDVMAYWGEAFSDTHPLWGQQDAPAARAVLARLAPTRAARLAKARTPRERAYLDAVETLYAGPAADGASGADTADGRRAARDTAFAAAMGRLAAAYPADDDAALFAALAGMGVGAATRDSAAYARAADAAEGVFRRHPDHPGASHYLIHAVDDPAHARRGLAAARAYTDLAPDAGHAQHMTSHIFVALGMWDDVVAANARALATVLQPDPAAVRVTPHDVYWLGYGLLQQGRFAEARRWTDRMRAQAARDPSGANRYHAAALSLAYLADTRGWASAYAAADTTDPTGALGAYVRAWAALGRGERAAADAALARLASERPAGRAAEERDRVFEFALGGLAARAAGRADSAVTLFRAAAAADEALPFMYGPPATVKPPRELAGELLLELGRPVEARAEFARALKRTPGRPAALLGLARAQRAAGDAAGAARTYAQLAATWRAADADVPGLAEVRAGARPTTGAAVQSSR